MATDPTTGVTSPNTAETLTSTKGTSATGDNAILGKDDFLKLLVGQMRNQDPLAGESNDPSKSMEQMTQFSILEQLTNLAKSVDAGTLQQKVSSAVGLIGHKVSYTKADGSSATGSVEAVQTAGDKVTLTIDGESGIDPAKVVEVN